MEPATEAHARDSDLGQERNIEGIAASTWGRLSDGNGRATPATVTPVSDPGHGPAAGSKAVAARASQPRRIEQS